MSITKQSYRFRKQTSDYQWEEGSREGQEVGRGLRDTKCYIHFSVLSNSLQSRGLLLARLFCTWDSPGKNTGTDCHFLLQGIFPTQGSNPRLLNLLPWQADSLPLEQPGKPQEYLFTLSIQHSGWCETL